MATYRRIKVIFDDRTPQKWSVSLSDDVFRTFLSQRNQVVRKVFGEGSMFSPLLFGKFFDPSDAFPLWKFESRTLVSKLRSSGKTSVDWFQTDDAYVAKAELPGIVKDTVRVEVDDGKIVGIYGQWKQQNQSETRDWRCGHWWEHGYVRRLELPQDADWTKVEAHVYNDKFLQIRIPKRSLEGCFDNGRHFGYVDKGRHFGCFDNGSNSEGNGDELAMPMALLSLKKRKKKPVLWVPNPVESTWVAVLEYQPNKESTEIEASQAFVSQFAGLQIVGRLHSYA